jgi:SEFIR domain/Effector-associated domain 9
MSIESLPPKVFISYSHDSQSHKDRVLALADRLRDDGIDCNIDQYEQSPSEGWQRWMLNEVEAADLVLVVCSEPYDRRFRGREEAGKGKGAIWEGGVIIQELYDTQGLNSKFIPIVLTTDDSKFIPSPLRSATHYRLIAANDYDLLYRRLTNQHSTPKQDLGKLRKLDRRERKQLFPDVLPTDSSSTNPISTGLTSVQRRQLETRRDGLLSEWELRNEKVNRMRMALIIETGAAVKFQLEQQLLGEEAELSKLAVELDEIEQKLN